MQKIICPFHNIDIFIYLNSEEEYFTDNNEKSVIIFTDLNGNKYLKRYIDKLCNENCETVKNILFDNNKEE